MNFGQCFKCKLTLPQYLLTPMLAQQGNQKIKVFLCRNCKEQIEKQKGQNHGENQ